MERCERTGSEHCPGRGGAREERVGMRRASAGRRRLRKAERETVVSIMEEAELRKCPRAGRLPDGAEGTDRAASGATVGGRRGKVPRRNEDSG